MGEPGRNEERRPRTERLSAFGLPPWLSIWLAVALLCPFAIVLLYPAGARALEIAAFLIVALWPPALLIWLAETKRTSWFTVVLISLFCPCASLPLLGLCMLGRLAWKAWAEPVVTYARIRSASHTPEDERE